MGDVSGRKSCLIGDISIIYMEEIHSTQSMQEEDAHVKMDVYSINKSKGGLDGGLKKWPNVKFEPRTLSITGFNSDMLKSC